MESVIQSKKTLNYRRLNYYLKKKEKMALYRKNLIKKLVESGYYDELYHRYTNENIKNLNDNDITILETMNYIDPIELNHIYKELFLL